MAVKADITIDIDKQVGNLQNLTNIYNARVGDNKTPLTVLWRKNGMALNLKGLHAFIAGKVGDGSYNSETDKVDFPVGTPVVKYEDDGSGTLDNGQSGLTTLLIPKQMWAKTGLFAGYIGLKDENGSVFTSKDIFFKVLGNVLDAGVAINYFIDDFSKVIQNSKLKLQESIDDARNTYESETKNAHDALINLDAQIKANRDNMQNLADHLASTDQQIQDHDIVTIPQHKNDIATISAAINKRLSEMKMAPVAIADLATLKNTYPHGTDGVYFALDNKHIYTYLSNDWQDMGVYQAADLDKAAQQAIGDTKSIVLGDNLIQNGSFSNGNISPASSTSTDTNLKIIQYLSRNWLLINSNTNTAYKGVKWTIDKNGTDTFTYPLQLEFDLKNADAGMPLTITAQYFDADGKRLGVQFIDQVTFVQWRLTHYHHVFNLDPNYSGCYGFNIQIVQNDGKPINNIWLTGVSLRYIYYHSFTPTNNLINNGSFTDGLVYPASPTTSDTLLSVKQLNNRNWLVISGDNNSAYKGAQWNLNAENLFNYPAQLSFEASATEGHTLAIYIAVYDKSNRKIGTQKIDDVSVNTNQYIHFSDKFILNEDLRAGASYVVLQINQPSTDKINNIYITDLKLQSLFDHPVKSGKNLIQNGDFSSYKTYPPYAVTNKETIKIENYLNKNWLHISSDSEDKTPYKGVVWNINSPEMWDYPLKLNIDFYAKADLSLRLDLQYFTKDGQKINQYVDTVSLNKDRLTNFTKTIHLLPKPDNFGVLKLQLADDNAEPIDFMITDVHLKLDFAKIKDLYGLPIFNIYGDLTGISASETKQITWNYADNQRDISGCGSLKWQGNSSLTWSKKSYRLKTLKSDFKSKNEIKFRATWKKHSKFNLKAYYTDGTMSRDPVNAQIGAAIWSSQSNLPQDTLKEDNFGLIDGFPVVLLINGSFEGIYSFNLPRPDFDYTKYGIMGNQWTKETQFTEIEPAVKLDGTDFESLNPKDEPTVDEQTAVNQLIKFVSTSSDTDFKDHFKDHLSLDSAIDYLILQSIINNPDAFAKNEIFLTWDGKIWYLHPYDLDDSFGASWNGNSTVNYPTALQASQNKLFARLMQLFDAEIRKRYAELRTWLTPEWVLSKYKARINQIGVNNYQKEYERWHSPAAETEDYNQLMQNVYNQFQFLDAKWLVLHKEVAPEPTQSTTSKPNTNTAKTDNTTATESTTPQEQPTEPKKDSDKQ